MYGIHKLGFFAKATRNSLFIYEIFSISDSWYKGHIYDTFKIFS